MIKDGFHFLHCCIWFIIFDMMYVLYYFMIKLNVAIPTLTWNKRDIIEMVTSQRDQLKKWTIKWKAVHIICFDRNLWLKNFSVNILQKVLTQADNYHIRHYLVLPSKSKQMLNKIWNKIFKRCAMTFTFDFETFFFHCNPLPKHSIYVKYKTHTCKTKSICIL